MENVKQLIEWSATVIEIATVLMIIGATVFGSLRFLIHLNAQVGDAYAKYRAQLGKMLILALEFLVAADIIRTVALDQTFGNILTLGLLVLIRTFLSWSLSVETEKRWPWSRRVDEPAREVASQ